VRRRAHKRGGGGVLLDIILDRRAGERDAATKAVIKGAGDVS